MYKNIFHTYQIKCAFGGYITCALNSLRNDSDFIDDVNPFRPVSGASRRLLRRKFCSPKLLSTRFGKS